MAARTTKRSASESDLSSLIEQERALESRLEAARMASIERVMAAEDEVAALERELDRELDTERDRIAAELSAQAARRVMEIDREANARVDEYRRVDGERLEQLADSLAEKFASDLTGGHL